MEATRSPVHIVPPILSRVMEPDMKKLKLDLNELAVETFATDHGSMERGTVAGHATNTCITARCNGTNLCTAGPSCDGTCYATCGDEPCNSQGIEYCGGTAYENSCAGGDCFQTDNENTCIHTCLDSCNVQTCAVTCRC